MNTFSRRNFLRSALAAAAGAALAASGCGGGPSQTDTPHSGQTIAEPSSGEAPPNEQAESEPALSATPSSEEPTAQPELNAAYMAVAHGSDPAAITRASIQAIGGMERFVKSGQDVIIKPNICVDYHPPEYAATTNPQVVAALVTMCLEAGAKRVRVMDNPFGGTGESAYARTGIGDAVTAAGGSMEVMGYVKFVNTEIPEGQSIHSWEIYQDALDCDVLINVPIAKNHELARLTLGGKNLFGLVRAPGMLHADMGQKLADLHSLIRPALTVVDAYRILMDHGPTGGSLDDVKETQTVIASHDLVATDAYAATLFGLKGEDIAYTKVMAERNQGTLDLSAIKIEEVNV
jgi:uncharacterized protein (DUF362 family)